MNIIQLVPNKGWGGGEKCVLELADALKNRGNNIIVIKPKCPVLDKKFTHHKTYTSKLSSINIFKQVAFFAKVAKNNKTEVVHCHIFKHALVAALARKFYGLHYKVIMTRHLCRKGKKSLRYNWLFSVIDNICFVSGGARDTFLSSNPKIDSSKIKVIQNRLNIPPQTIQKRDESEIYTFAMAGRLHPEKGVKEMIEAAYHCKNNCEVPFALKIAGVGTPHYEAEIKASVEELQLLDNVTFVGFIEDIPAFFAGVDCVVTPSIAKEAFPLTTLEAMACGRAIISSNGGQSEMVDNNKEAIILDAISDITISKAMQRVLRDRKFSEDMGIAAQKRFLKQFKFDDYIDLYSELYSE